ncbi:MAG: lytic transglycosylase domain-containing protein [Bacteroidia bacterium]|nr:MAG: lytic transglycosylase domain-containing protein [Bacteroidia bacterium]
MKINAGKAAVATMMVLSAGFIITILVGGSGAKSEAEMETDGPLKATSWALPESASFAGEAMPLENFDTRESLDRELNATAYRHGSTLLTIKRAGRYFPEIEKILKENGIPDDFKYLACAESDLSNAVSPMGATGFWQIMESTGKEYGMIINNEVDERYSLERSTVAACKYFRKAYQRYGSWTMAAASYNNGMNGLDEQVKIQKETNYYDLLLNEDSARYIFRITALKLIIAEPDKYGFTLEEKDFYNPVAFTEVKVDSTVKSFEQFSRHFDTNYKMLKFLNPWLRKPFLTNTARKEYVIRVPQKGARVAADL